MFFYYFSRIGWTVVVGRLFRRGFGAAFGRTYRAGKPSDWVGTFSRPAIFDDGSIVLFLDRLVDEDRQSLKIQFRVFVDSDGSRFLDDYLYAWECLGALLGARSDAIVVA